MSTYFIATNALFNQCSSLYCISLANTMGEFAAEGSDSIVPILFDGYGNNAMSINQVITWAHKNNADGLFLIGANMGWDVEVLRSIVGSDKDVLAAPVFYNGQYILKLGEISRLEKDEGSGEIKVQNASLDFFFLRRNAIEALCESHPTVTYNGEEIKMILQSGDIYTSYHTNEDILSFRLKEAGFHTWVNPGLKVRTSSQTISQSSLSEDLERELKRQ